MSDTPATFWGLIVTVIGSALIGPSVKGWFDRWLKKTEGDVTIQGVREQLLQKENEAWLERREGERDRAERRVDELEKEIEVLRVLYHAEREMHALYRIRVLAREDYVHKLQGLLGLAETQFPEMPPIGTEGD